METDFGSTVFAIILTVGVADAIPRRLDTGSGWTSFDADDDGRSGSLGRAGGGETESGSFSFSAQSAPRSDRRATVGAGADRFVLAQV